MGRLADKFRQKMEKLEDKLYRLSARTQSKILTKRVSYKDQHGMPQMNKKSSWIRSYAWDSHTSTLYMTTHKGKTYAWDNIDFDTAEQVKAGLGVQCTTDDPTGRNRWFVGKHPSLGAAFWQILKPITRSVVMNPPPALNYADISIEGYDTRYNVDFRGPKPKRGRPEKDTVKARDYGWTGRYKKPRVGGTP